MSVSTPSSVNLSTLVRDFQKGRCIVFLGPRLEGVLQNEQWKPTNQTLSRLIAEKIEEENIPIEANLQHDLPHLAQTFIGKNRSKEKNRLDLEDLILDFLHQQQDEMPPVYQAIAQLPAAIFINTTFDMHVWKALKERHNEVLFHYYNFKKNTQFPYNENDFSASKPLVYNLFGNIEKPESLVLSESEQMQFIRNVVKNDPPLPDEITGYFDNRKTYIFLGFNMENWQFRLLLDSLKLKDENSTLATRTPQFPMSYATQAFYQDHFNFVFVEKDVEEFLTDLQDLFEKEETTATQSVYLTCHPNDQLYLEELEKHLLPLEKDQQVKLWHRGRILPGDIAANVQREQLDKAQVLVLLLSADLLADDDFLDTELEPALERQRSGQLKICLVPTRACDWRINRDLRRFAPPLLEDDKPIVTWTNRDEAYHRIVQELKKRLHA